MAELIHGVAWTTDLETGNKEIDLQHQYLFGVLSDLINTCSAGDSTEKQLAALDFLCEYTARHFKDEEALQIKYGYPDYERHKRLHEDFGGKLAGLLQKFTGDCLPDELRKDITWLVLNWLLSHIQVEDRKLAGYIRTCSAP